MRNISFNFRLSEDQICLECGQRLQKRACFVVIIVMHIHFISLETANASVAAKLGALVAMGLAVCDHGARLYL